MATFIVGAVVFVLVVMAVFGIAHGKKNGKSSCGCGCSGCSGCSGHRK